MLEKNLLVVAAVSLSKNQTSLSIYIYLLYSEFLEYKVHL